MREGLPTEYGAISIYRIWHSKNARGCNTFQRVIIGKSIDKVRLLVSDCNLVTSAAKC
jgi:hypothetical protein